MYYNFQNTFKVLSYGSLFTSTKGIARQCHFSALGMTTDAVLFKGRDNCKISEYLKHTKSTQPVLRTNYQFSSRISKGRIKMKVRNMNS